MSITIQLESGKQFTVQETPNLKTAYRIMGRNTVDRLTNKDLTDPSNKINSQQYSKFTVSADPTTRAAYTTIQSAIDAAAETGNCETVWILAGNYEGDIELRPRVNLAGFGIVKILGKVNSCICEGEITIADLTICAPCVPVAIHGGAHLHFSNTVIHGGHPIMVNNCEADVTFTETALTSTCTIMEVCNARAITFIRCEIGTDACEDPIRITSARVKILYCIVKSQLILTCDCTTVSHCTLTGRHEDRVHLCGGSLELTHCDVVSASCASYFITGNGTVHEAYNKYTGNGEIVSPCVNYDNDRHLSGMYSPNMTSDIPDQYANGTALYYRVGNIVTVKFQALLTCGPTQSISIFISLPLTPRNFCSATDAIGTVRINQPEPAGEMLASITADGQAVHFTATADAASFVCGLVGEFSYKYM